MRTVSVEILHTPGCAHWQAARDRVLDLAACAGIPIAVSETIVDTREEAQERRFRGSPTVRVEGRDIQQEIEALGLFGLG